ncbi:MULTISPECIES: DUF397 domain-containing protein [unclassified Streptomyces]|uniref:DUF397 domain-containing protein n=1 Tax=Streptomycetaceae TaxID=2062 RepID=UPI00037C3FB1|nr:MULTISPECIES: DUF397 domain-containing protein [unclassified Streptomyces]MYX34001.1 DUF397 domain-containing protein [Streptomyces sp. SID8377]
MRTRLVWFTSSYSDDQGGNCVEVATTPQRVHVRDSKDPDGPALSFTPAAWAEFLRDVGRDAAPPSE